MLSMDGTPRHASTPADDAAPEDRLGDTVALAQKGDEDAFRSIYRAVQPGLLRYLRGLVGDDAEDVASEAWSQIARDLTAFHGDGPGFRAWVVTIARNRALDHLRQQRRRPQSAGIAASELTDRAAEEDTAGAALDRVSTDDAIALIAALPRDQAEAVLLRAVMGLDVATAAKVLGKRPGAVRTAAHRGLRRLADRLGRAAEETGAETAGGVDAEA
jgi:RNA polymerase sigma-70 factor (ECF subfamily)